MDSSVSMLTPPLSEPTHWSFVVGGRSQVCCGCIHFEDLDAVFGLCSCRPILGAVKENGVDERSIEPDLYL